MRPARSVAISLALLLGLAQQAQAQAQAQDASRMSCEELWLARNQIYANNGYCFQSQRARAIFGPGCIPPFGKLAPEEAREVAVLQSWERRRGCTG